VLGELWSGVECSASRERNLRSLRKAISWLLLWQYTEEAAAEFGRIFAELKRAGRIIQQIDMQIGAIARTLPNCAIVSKDSDLVAIPGAIIENWAS
jgi:tRNA(fMet)-specific endonuclease VapC